MNSPANSAKVIELRALLQQRFPEAHASPQRKIQVASTTGISCIDQLSLDRGCMTEVVGAQACCGAGVLLAGLLDHSLRGHRPAALIDAQDAFDPSCLTASVRHRLLWVRCHQRVEDSLRAADLLLRDGNLPLIVLDLLGASTREVQRVPGSVWFRLRTLSEQSGAAFLALTPCKTIPSAQRRLESVQTFVVDAVDEPLRSLLGDLHLHTLLERMHWHAVMEAPQALAA